ncbi:hypothetical protein N7467_010375 [Penicillium canescens]|nr:hypothetical protein N7467_010375 [Penicillium canescens]
MIAPRKTFVEKPNSDPASLFLIQANIITGGLILTFVAQHNTMDMTGQAHIIHLFSKACRDEFYTCAIATYLSRTANEATFSATAGFDTAVDLILSSWAKLKGYGLDFSLGLGMPLAVRRPLYQPVQGLAFLVTKTLHGDIEAAICLRGEDMERPRADVEFAKYGTYIG